MEELESVLDDITVSMPSQDGDIPPMPPKDVPESYTSNNKKERVLLRYAENFQRQFRQLYSDRKPLLLTPLNEHNIPKFICTTMRPTYLQYKELYEYDSCASFVADYLTYEPLKIPNEVPTTLVSPTLVLEEQTGNCFDYAVLLTSLLIGVGYDAFCVCGYASRDVCLLDLSRKPCPLLQEKPEIKERRSGTKKNRYTARPPRDLSSKFDRRQRAKEQAKILKEEQKAKEEEEARIAELEAPPTDELLGLRVHCWVLVLMGKREVTQNFFIEPTTGETHPINWKEYHGIELLWNHKNYWVNMQDCSDGIQDMVYDLGDAAKWEFFFPNVERALLVLPGEAPPIEMMESEESFTEPENIKEDFQLPPSWVLPIEISPKDLETRCPKGSKTILYYRAKLEKFAEYLNEDGLVNKLTVFSDTARTIKSEMRHLFQHRKDLLTSRVEKMNSGEVQESFKPGRQRSLKSHIHYGSNPLRAGHRTMEFYSHARVDGLVKRQLTPTEMVEHFVDRPDFLCYRQVIYEKIPKKYEPSGGSTKPKNIVKVVEKFLPNPAIPPNQDIAERTFLLPENLIKVAYQLEEGRITASHRDLITPPMNPEQAVLLTLNPDDITTYQVDPFMKEPKNLHLFQQLESLVQAREDCIFKIRESEEENEAILNARTDEELNFELTVSVYDVVRNETARRHRQELELKMAEEERIRKEKEKDYLAPYLARIGDPPVLSLEQMKEVMEDCLKDLRGRLVDMANIIQSRFEYETEKLQKKQAWYKSKQGSLTKEEEADYVTFCNDTMFTIHILEQRLNRHKQIAPKKYMELDNRLKEDPRVCRIYASRLRHT